MYQGINPLILLWPYGLWLVISSPPPSPQQVSPTLTSSVPLPTWLNVVRDRCTTRLLVLTLNSQSLRFNKLLMLPATSTIVPFPLNTTFQILILHSFLYHSENRRLCTPANHICPSNYISAADAA